MPRPNPLAMYRVLRRAGVPRFEIAAAVVHGLISREARGVHRLLGLHEHTRPGRVAVVQGERRVTYAELAARARRIAGALGARGIGPGARVAVFLPNCPETIAISGALRTLGAQAVPASPHLKREEIEHVLRDARASALFYAGAACAGPLAAARAVGLEPRLTIAVGEGGGAGVALEDLLAGPELPLPADELDGADRPAILYTSGTTGVPKGARPEIEDPIAMMERFARLFRLGRDETILLPAPLYHAAPAVFGQLAMLLGATLVLPAKFDPEDALRLIERERVTFAYFVPFMLEAILRLPEEMKRRYDRTSLRGVVSAAAQLRPETRLGACDFFGDVLFEFYGATETGIATFLEPEEQRRKPDSVGRPIEGVCVRILGEDGRELGPGRVGEVAVGTRWLRIEYEGRPEETAAAYAGGAFFRTGDLGFIDAEGYLHIAGRAKDMVNSAGVKVFPAEVERVLAQHPAVADVAVLPVADEKWGEAVWAAVVRAEGAPLEEQELIAWAKERLAAFKAPKRVVFERELPRNPAGKVLKRVLRERYEATR